MIPLLHVTTLLLAIAFAPAQGVVLEPKAKVAGTRILLRDLVADENEHGLSREILDLDVGRAPSPAFARVIDRRLIASLLPGIDVTGAETCSLESETATIERLDIEKAARELLENHALVTSETTIELVRSPITIVVAKGRDSRKLVPKLRGKPVARGPVTVQVDIEVDGSLVRSSQVGFELRTKGSFAVLAADIPRGTELSHDHVRFVEIDTTDVNVARIDPDLVVGQLARRDLKAGTPLRLTDYVAEALVKRGDHVRLVFKRGGLELETRGIAKGTASLGETVRIENADSKRPLVGTVAGPGIVVVDR